MADSVILTDWRQGARSPGYTHGAVVGAVYSQVIYFFKFLCLFIFLLMFPGALGCQKRPLDLLELKLQRVVSCHVGAGN